MMERKRHTRRSDRGRQGQTLVEFALVFPLQLFFILAILDLALLQVGRLLVSYAAYSAAHAELMGQDPTEAAAIVLMPLCSENIGSYYGEVEPYTTGTPPMPAGQTDFPGWVPMLKWQNARNRVLVCRLINWNYDYTDWSSNVLNRTTVVEDVPEDFHTNSVSQHNIGIEVRFLYRLRLPLSIFAFLWAPEEIQDFNQWQDSVVVLWDGQPHMVLRERCLMPNTDRLIRTTLPIKDIEGEEISNPIPEVPEDIEEPPPSP
jgi:hypothetical protein